MWKWMQKSIIVVSVFFLTALLWIMFIERAGEIAHAEAVEKPVREMNRGDAIVFAGKVWIVLEPSSGFVFMYEKLDTRRYHYANKNIFSVSDTESLGYYLNRYYVELPEEERSAIREVEWDNGHYGNVTAKIGLLTASEWTKYGKTPTGTGRILDPPSETMWLITPLSNDSAFQYAVNTNGDTILESPFIELAYHPAMYLDPNHVTHKMPDTVVTFSPNGSDDWAQSHAIVVTANNDFTSFSELEYAWSTNERPPWDNWQHFENGATIFTPTDQTGTYYLHIQNVRGRKHPFHTVSNAFALDAVQPSSPTITVPTGWTNIVSVEMTPGEDEDSGVKETNYRMGQDDIWGDWTVLGEEGNIVIEEEGEITLKAVTIDHAGNRSDVSSDAVNIDRTAPELSVAMTKQESNMSYSSGEWTNENVLVSVSAEDQVGLSGMKTLEMWLDGEQVSNVAGTSHPFVFDQEGIYHLEMAATDQAGNVATADRSVKISQSGLTMGTTLKQTDDSVYASGEWTRQSVTASVYADHSQGVPIKSIAYSLDQGLTWSDYMVPLTFREEGRHSLWFKVLDEADNEMRSRSTILIDVTAPIATYFPDGNDRGTPQKAVSTKIEVIEDCSKEKACSGLDESTLTSIWSMSAEPLDEQADWESFQNGDTLTQLGDDGVWYLHIRAEDDAGNKAYTISKAFHLDDPTQRNAQLSSLLIDTAELQSFDPDTLEYTVQVGHHTRKIAVTPTTEMDGASIKMRMNNGHYTSVTSGEISPELDLEVGQNTVEILVTALNGTFTKTYTIEVVRDKSSRYLTPVLSSNAQLKEMTISDGVLTPGFAQDALQYTVEVPYEKVSLVIHPVPEHTKAKALVRVNGEMLKSGEESLSVALNVGTNIIHVDVTAEDGTKIIYEIIVTRGEEPQRLSPVPDESSCLPNKVRFTDLDGHWSESSIREAVCMEIVTGYPDGTFKPDDPITRAEFTLMLAGAMNWQSEGNALTFIDRQLISSWAEEVIAQAVEAGVVIGYFDGSFRPDAPINRAEMAVMIAKALELEAVDEEKAAFADDSNIPIWAKGAVENLRKQGIVSGRGDNQFAARAKATRAEAAVMVMRMWIYMKQN